MKINLDKISTEKQNERSLMLDQMDASEIVSLINDEDKKVAYAIEKAKTEISEVVSIAAETIKNDGRIIYIGAGTSGRLGVLDAVECPPTYGVDYNTVLGLMAGGEAAFVKAQEGAEDDEELVITDLKAINLTKNDLVIGIAASGRTPYVISGLKYGNEIGASTASIAITYNSEVAKYAKNPIEVEVGAEVVTGSTRMKAGTAQKMILNMITTGAMVLNGKVYQNLMVDVMQTNEKLKERAKNIVVSATDCDEITAEEKLKAASGNAKLAIVMILLNVDVKEAEKKLSENGGKIINVLSH